MDHLADSIAKLSQGRENWYIGREGIPVDDLSIYLSLNTATRPRGHFRQVSAASVSIRQEKIKYRQRIKSMIVKDKNR